MMFDSKKKSDKTDHCPEIEAVLTSILDRISSIESQQTNVIDKLEKLEASLDILITTQQSHSSAIGQIIQHESKKRGKTIEPFNGGGTVETGTQYRQVRRRRKSDAL